MAIGSRKYALSNAKPKAIIVLVAMLVSIGSVKSEEPGNVTCGIVRPLVCTYEYLPVCGQKHSTTETFPNTCMACADSDVISHTSGACNATGINEPTWESLQDQSPIIGSLGDDLISDSPEYDQIWGGEGADTFVLNFISKTPDQIMDFDPQEGDSIQLAFLGKEKALLKSGKFTLDRKGVVKLTLLDGEVIPLVNIRRSDLTVNLNPRSQKFELKFSKQF